MNQTKLLAIDVAKNVFQVCGGNKHGKILFNKKLTRQKLMAFIVQLPKDCVIVMETGRAVYHLGRTFIDLGYETKLIAAQFVKPFVKGNKNDRNDAVAIYEAASRPDMRFVPVKTLEQQDIQSLHRARNLATRQWRALGNQIRAFLAEYGLNLPAGVQHVRKSTMSLLEDAENGLTNAIRDIINDLYQQYCEQEEIIAQYDAKLKNLAHSREDCELLMKLPGVGPMIATIIVSSVGDAKQFKNGREMSAWMGLTPRHKASGNRCVMGSVSKRVNKYLRVMILHGARAIIRNCETKDDRMSRWVKDKREKIGGPKAIVALGNKMIREIWALLQKKEQFVFE